MLPVVPNGIPPGVYAATSPTPSPPLRPPSRPPTQPQPPPAMQLDRHNTERSGSGNSNADRAYPSPTTKRRGRENNVMADAILASPELSPWAFEEPEKEDNAAATWASQPLSHHVLRCLTRSRRKASGVSPSPRTAQGCLVDDRNAGGAEAGARGGGDIAPSESGHASVLPKLEPATDVPLPQSRPPSLRLQEKYIEEVQEGAAQVQAREGWAPTEQPLAWALHALVVPVPFIPLHSIARQATTAHRYPLLNMFGPEFKEHLHGVKSAKVREREEGKEWGGGDGDDSGGSGGWRSSAEVGPGAASGEFGMGKEAVPCRCGGRDDGAGNAGAPVFNADWDRAGVSGSAAAPATGAHTPQPDASSPDFLSHSAAWDA
ncbi:hypothetical protein FIBSPDRAFT_1001132 [Athelia psychrophila]|uniref:Uncharacterized protein n=1 Tax=Athelia psychrophila TaxID=1759441 RepID=A0A167WYK6_9AGAM|nr:hypothetical protein FIBSPDRAFT_1001132 [Fibularhizoctonia sp. CBS 109695]